MQPFWSRAFPPVPDPPAILERDRRAGSSGSLLSTPDRCFLLTLPARKWVLLVSDGAEPHAAVTWAVALAMIVLTFCLVIFG